MEMSDYGVTLDYQNTPRKKKKMIKRKLEALKKLWTEIQTSPHKNTYKYTGTSQSSDILWYEKIKEEKEYTLVCDRCGCRIKYCGGCGQRNLKLIEN